MRVSQSQRSGGLEDAQPLPVRLLPALAFPYGVSAWRLQYQSATAQGSGTVSATVLQPRRANGALIGIAPATRGMGPNAAPSLMLPRGLDLEGATLLAALRRGWTLVITDYAGLGTGGAHPYMVGEILGRNVLHAMQATRELLGDQVRGPLGILGYSAGGYAAGWAAQLQPTLAPELILSGVACGAAPADPGALAEALHGSIFGAFLAYALLGYSAAFPDLDEELQEALTPHGRATLDVMRDRSLVRALLRPSRRPLTDPPVASLPGWQARFTEQTLGAVAPVAPVLLYHAPADRLVPFRLSRALAQQWGAQGASVEVQRVLALDHASGGMLGTPRAINWLAGRLSD